MVTLFLSCVGKLAMVGNENIRCFVGAGNALLIALPDAFPRDVSSERIRLSFVIVCFLFASEVVCVSSVLR